MADLRKLKEVRSDTYLCIHIIYKAVHLTQVRFWVTFKIITTIPADHPLRPRKPLIHDNHKAHPPSKPDAWGAARCLVPCELGLSKLLSGMVPHTAGEYLDEDILYKDTPVP